MKLTSKSRLSKRTGVYAGVEFFGRNTGIKQKQAFCFSRGQLIAILFIIHKFRALFISEDFL